MLHKKQFNNEKPRIIESGLILEEKIKTLKKLKVDVEKWEVFYVDERTHEKWIREFPFAYLQAGGPPQLRLLEKFPWE